MSSVEYKPASPSERQTNSWFAHFNPAHLLAMTDDTGMLQHSRYAIPDRRHGYALDDNVRAMLAAAQSSDPLLTARLPIYLSFVMYCQRPDGQFINFMSYDRRFLEKVGSPDSQGRTLWTLGGLYLENSGYRSAVEPLLTGLRPHLANLAAPRAIAFAGLGLYNYGLARPASDAVGVGIQADLIALAEQLVGCWHSNQHPDWHWFEDSLTYENARLPQALFAAYRATGRPDFLKIARQAADVLTELHFKDGYLKLIGNDGWLKRGQAAALFDEQPVDAGALVEMYALAYEATGEPAYIDLAHRALGWYRGENCQGLALYNPLTGGCYDGLEADGVNYNQGAESVLSYALAQQAALKLPGRS